MGQAEVYNFLKSVKELYQSTQRIAEETKQSVESVRASLNKLYKWDEVEFKRVNNKNKKIWRIKKR